MRKVQKNNGSLYIGTIIIVTIVWGLVCAKKNIYPFGNLILAGNGDYLAQYLPMYHYMWDVLHGQADLGFSWLLGLGTDVSGGVSHFYLLSPFSLLLLPITRAQVPYAMTWIIGVKFICAALSMLTFLVYDRYLIKNRQHKVLMVIVACGYAYNAQTLMYYGMGWIETAVFFPLAVLCVNRVLDREEKGRLWNFAYIGVMTIIFCLNIPQAYAVCLFMVFYAGGISIVERKRKEPGCGLFHFMLDSVLALGISAFAFLPALYNTAKSYRFNMFYDQKTDLTDVHGVTYLIGAIRNFLYQYHVNMAAEGMEFFRKWRILGSISIPLVLIVFLELYKWSKGERKSTSAFKLYLLTLCLLPFVCEVVNLMWNNGVYICFPMRYGYIMIFTVLIIAYDAWEQLLELIKQKYLNAFMCILPMLIWGFMMATLVNQYVLATGNTLWYEEKSWSSNSVLDRVASREGKMYVDNEAVQIGVSMLANYYPLNSAERLEQNQRLGYAQEYVRLSDQGGTILSDLLLRLTSVNGDGEVIYDMRDVPEIIYCSNENYELMLETEETNVFQEQNKIARLLFGEDLITTYQYELKAGEHITDELRIDHKAILYAYVGNQQTVNITVNETGLQLENQVIRIWNLGQYDCGTISYEIDAASPTETLTVWIAELNYDEFEKKLSQLVARNDHLQLEENGMTGDVIVPEDGYALVSVYSEEGWNLLVNGKETEKMEFENLLFWPVEKGKNEVELIWKLPLQREGGWITGISLLILMILSVLIILPVSGKKVLDHWRINQCAIGLMNVTVAFFMLYIYIIPMVYRGLRFIKNILR